MRQDLARSADRIAGIENLSHHDLVGIGRMELSKVMAAIIALADD